MAGYILALNYNGITLSDTFQTANTIKNNWVTNSDPFYAASSGRTFSREEQTTILGQVQASYYFNVVMCQFWHIWIVRNRFQSSLAKNPFRNVFTNIGVLCEV